MRVAIVGCGYVGTVTGACFAALGHDVAFFDVDKEKLVSIGNCRSPICEPGLDNVLKDNRMHIRTAPDLSSAVKCSDVTFICVGTPSQENGAIDLQYILSAGSTIGQALQDLDKFHSVIIKSTVFPGTTESSIQSAIERESGKRAYADFGLGSNPEFLREGNAVIDFFNPDRIVIGAADERTKDLLRSLYSSFNCPILETSIRTAEMIKYTSNAFLATKISFANEIGNLSKIMGIDAHEVFTGVGLDHRIGQEFLRTGIGFGGSCFPKDIRALIAGASEYGVTLGICIEALRVNEEQPLKLIEILKRHLPNLNGKTIGVLGLAFKPETDDVRESRAVPIVEHLLNQDSHIVAYDPLAMENFQQIFPQVEYAPSAEAVLSADAILILTEWKEFEGLAYDGKTVIDGRRVAAARQTAKIYEGVCW